MTPVDVVFAVLPPQKSKAVRLSPKLFTPVVFENTSEKIGIDAELPIMHELDISTVEPMLRFALKLVAANTSELSKTLSKNPQDSIVAVESMTTTFAFSGVQ